MEREIKFRGKRLDNGEWVYGYLVKMWGEWHIIDWDDENSAYPVNPDTIGQYTRVNDVNNKPAYSCDLVRTTNVHVPGIYQIGFKHGCYCLMDKDGNVWYYINEVKFEVVGTIFDNPELLED